jgi:hypothetical protein
MRKIQFGIKQKTVSVTRIALSLIFVGLFGYSTSGSAYLIYGTKFGDSAMKTSGGTVSWSFLPAGAHCLDGICTHVSEIMEDGYEYVFQRAFDTWGAVADISFFQVESGQDSDIGIGAHEISWPVAHAYYPPDSQIHFSTLFPWGIDSIIPIFPIAVHEIGHSIGLAHSTIVESVMLPSTSAGYRFRYELASDDIAGIQAIYGAPVSLPGTAWLLGSGLFALFFSRRRFAW